MKTYSKSRLWPFSKKWFIIYSLILGILTSGPFFFIVGPLEVGFFGLLIMIYKNIFFPNQFGVAFSIDGNNFSLKDKKYAFKDVVEFGRFNVRYYGSQISVTVSADGKKKTVKFFSPDAAIIERDLIGIIKQRGNTLKAQEKTFPLTGIVYKIS